MFEVLRSILQSLTFNQLIALGTFILTYHLALLFGLYLLIRSTVSIRMRTLEARANRYQRKWETPGGPWKDREEELRRLFNMEKEREVAKVKAEYDGYIALLEQKLQRSRGKEM